MLRQRHLAAVLHIMGYLKLKHNFKLAFDTSYSNIDHRNFQECDWTDYYEGDMETIPPNASPPRGKEVDLCMFVDNDHAGNKWTWKFMTGFIMYMSMSLIN